MTALATDLFALLSQGQAVTKARFAAAPLVEAMWWHPMYDSDPARRWLRGLLTEVGAGLSP